MPVMSVALADQEFQLASQALLGDLPRHPPS